MDQNKSGGAQTLCHDRKTYKQFIRPIIYIWGTPAPLGTRTPKNEGKELEAVQFRAARMVNNRKPMNRTTSATELISSMKWDPLSTRRKHRCLAVFTSFHFNTNRVRSYLKPNPPILSIYYIQSQHLTSS